MAAFGDRELSDIARQVISKQRPIHCPRCKAAWTLDPPVRSGSYVMGIVCEKCKCDGDVSYTVR